MFLSEIPKNMQEVKASTLPVAVYHWWSFPEEKPAYQNLRTPIVASIASLRAVSDVEIVVLDGSDHDVDWGPFKKILNFSVQKWHLGLWKFQDKIEGWRHLSRIGDILNWSSYRYHQDIMYVDSDVFFFRDPFPLSCQTDKFCWDGWNTGFFYFNNCSSGFQDFYKLFCTYRNAAIYSEEIRNLMKKYVGYDAWYGVWDEMILSFMKAQHQDLFNFIPAEEHTTASNLNTVDCPKIFHANGAMMPNLWTGEKHARGLIALMFNEFYNKMHNLLGKKNLESMYGNTLCEYFDKNRINLLDAKCMLDFCKDNDGHYQFQKLLRSITII